MWIGQRIGGTYIAMPALAWVLLAPVIVGAMMCYYMCYGLAVVVVMACRHYQNRRRRRAF